MAVPLDHFLKWEKETPTNTFLRQPVNGVWKAYTFGQVGLEVRKVASAIKALKLPAKSKIAILSKNCAHWIMADLAIWLTGNISIPLYPTLTAPSIRQILEHSESAAIFLGKLDSYSTQHDGIPGHLHKISFPFYGINEGLTWNDALAQYPALTEYQSPGESDLATIMYTSGTTGKPKGVMLSFGGMEYVVSNALRGFKLEYSKERFFSYLPLSHIAERNLVELGAIYTGAEIWFSESLDKFPANLMEAQPTVFLAVPRIWAKFQEKILENLPQRKLNRLLRIPILNSVIKRTVKKKLGIAKAKWVLSGAAPLSVSLLEWFSKLGIVIHEVYGMTENEAYSHINLDQVKFGTVGKQWPDIEVRLSPEGEVQTKHPGVMMGYYKEPDLTSEVFTADGYLRTGDVGSIDNDGFLSITGRVKDLFKTDKGKYIAPSPIELKLSAHPDIEQVLVVGMGIPQPIALITLSASAKARSRSEIETSLSSGLALVNEVLESYEKLEKAVVLKEDWTVENGFMTPSLKVKRNELEKVYVPRYSMWYEMKGIVLWE